MSGSANPIHNPLREMYARHQRPLPTLTVIADAAMPEPYRQLLAHTRDMTPTLEKHHGVKLRLRVLDRHESSGLLARMVVLESMEAPHFPVEFGAIRIHLERFGRAVQGQILACQVPLGTLLNKYSIAHSCRPAAYFAVAADAIIGAALQLSGGPTLYGRFNTLYDPTGAPLAEVVEILAPTARTGEQR